MKDGGDVDRKDGNDQKKKKNSMNFAILRHHEQTSLYSHDKAMIGRNILKVSLK